MRRSLSAKGRFFPQFPLEERDGCLRQYMFYKTSMFTFRVSVKRREIYSKVCVVELQKHDFVNSAYCYLIILKQYKIITVLQIKLNKYGNFGKPEVSGVMHCCLTSTQSYLCRALPGRTIKYKLRPDNLRVQEIRLFLWIFVGKIRGKFGDFCKEIY